MSKAKEVLERIEKFDVNEAKAFLDPEDRDRAINEALDNLAAALKKVKNPEIWANKRASSLPGFIDQVERITKVLIKMK